MTCGVLLAAGALAWRANADQWDKRTILTVSGGPVQVRNTLLEPGQYVFKLMNSQADRHIVQIFNADQTRLVGTVLAEPAYRVEPRGHSVFTFWETPPGYAKALRTWYYPGDNFGQEFPYPKQLAMLQTSTAGEAQAAQTQTQQESNVEEQTPPPPQEQVPPETAQAEQPQQPAPAETPTPAPMPETQPQTLPKTASPYPFFGLGGLVLVGLYGLIRLRRLA
jgi:hypothetical protein